MSDRRTRPPGVDTGTPPPDAAAPLRGEDEPEPGLAVTLNLETADLSPPLDGWLQPLLARVAFEAGVTEGVLNLLLVDDRRMGELHGLYKDDPETTDVLTFDLREREDDPIEGDIVICRDEAQRQASRRGHDARLEALLYAVHGLMHLLGETDEDEEGFEQMHAREDRLLNAVGLGNVFSRRASDGDGA